MKCNIEVACEAGYRVYSPTPRGNSLWVYQNPKPAKTQRDWLNQYAYMKRIVLLVVNAALWKVAHLEPLTYYYIEVVQVQVLDVSPQDEIKIWYGWVFDTAHLTTVGPWRHPACREGPVRRQRWLIRPQFRQKHWFFFVNGSWALVQQCDWNVHKPKISHKILFIPEKVRKNVFS